MQNFVIAWYGPHIHDISVALYLHSLISLTVSLSQLVDNYIYITR